jgi:hypothetical protein
MDKELIHFICTAFDQGYRRGYVGEGEPNTYSETDFDGATHYAWQLGYERCRRREISRIDFLRNSPETQADNQEPSRVSREVAGRVSQPIENNSRSLPSDGITGTDESEENLCVICDNQGITQGQTCPRCGCEN